MIETDAGDDRHFRPAHVGRIEPPTQAHLEHGPVHVTASKMQQAQGGHDLEKRRRRLAPPLNFFTCRCHGAHAADQVFRLNRIAINLNPLLNVHQVGRGIQARPEPRRLQDAREHRRRRPFALGARDVNDLELLLRIAQELHEQPHPVELQRPQVLRHAKLLVIDPAVPVLHRLLIRLDAHAVNIQAPQPTDCVRGLYHALMPTPITVLVTGSAGRLGQAAVIELLRQGHQVRGIDCRPSAHLPHAVIDSLQTRSPLLDFMRGADAVIHLAATPDDLVWPLPPKAGDNFLTHLVPNNLVPAYHVLEAARETRVQRVVLASSGQVVWDQSFAGPFPIRTDAQPTPRWWYACTKVMLEHIGEAYAKQGFFSVVAARLGFCPRDADQMAELASLDRNQDVYLSPADAGRFFACAATKERPTGSFDVVYALSRPKFQVRFDPEPAERLLGFTPQDTWPEGIE